MILRAGHEDVAVVGGAVGAALIMTVTAVAGLETDDSLTRHVVAELVALGVLDACATAHHLRSTQVAMSASVVAIGAVIVLLENTG